MEIELNYSVISCFGFWLNQHARTKNLPAGRPYVENIEEVFEKLNGDFRNMVEDSCGNQNYTSAYNFNEDEFDSIRIIFDKVFEYNIVTRHAIVNRETSVELHKIFLTLFDMEHNDLFLRNYSNYRIVN